MSERTEILQAYLVKLTFSSGRQVTFSQKLLTPTQAESIADDLVSLARESGLEILRLELYPANRDEREQIIDWARSVFAEEKIRETLPNVRTAVKCTVCQNIFPWEEALSSSPQADVFLSGDPIAGDSRCEICSCHSVENCYECRSEWFLVKSQSAFICNSCRQRLENEVA